MIGVIADDLTGAAELAAVGWRHGMRAEIIGSALPSKDVDLVCVDTDSRSVMPEEAGRRAGCACETLQRSGAQWIYKKVDSVLRGHVVGEVQAILNQTDCQSALIVPANPAKGRIVRDGEYLIGGTPLHETQFGHDPAYPRTSSRILDLLGDSCGGSVKVCSVQMEQLPGGIVVGEASSAADVQCWAGRRSPKVLMGGAAEFFDALLEEDRTAGTVQEGGAPELPADDALFVCGSRSESAAQFVDSARRQGAPVFALPGASVAMTGEAELVDRIVEEFRSRSCVVLTTPSDEIPDEAASHGLLQHLTRIASAVMRKTGVSHAYVEGGATAVQLLTQLGWDRLTVVCEQAPGVVTLGQWGRRGFQLTLKPGSYVWPEAVQDKVKS